MFGESMKKAWAVSGTSFLLYFAVLCSSRSFKIGLTLCRVCLYRLCLCAFMANPPPLSLDTELEDINARRQMKLIQYEQLMNGSFDEDNKGSDDDAAVLALTEQKRLDGHCMSSSVKCGSLNLQCRTPLCSDVRLGLAAAGAGIATAAVSQSIINP